MKVLYLPSWYPPDGGSFFVNQIEALSKKGIETSVMYSRNIGRDIIYNPFKFKDLFGEKIILENGIEVYRNNYFSIPKSEKLTLDIYCMASERLFKKYFSKNGLPDLIHVHSSLWGGRAAEYLSEKYDVPYIITEHRGRFTLLNNFAKCQVKDSYTPILKSVFNNSSGVILVGGHLYNGLSKYYDHDDVYTEIIPNGVNTDFFTPGLKNNNGLFVFVTVTSLIKLKGIDWLLSSFANALKELKSNNIQLRIIGDGPEREYLEKLALNLGIENYVSFLGRLDPEGVKDNLQSADSFILPSRFEAQPVSYLEALSAGLPIICSKAVPVEIFHDFIGYRVEIDNSEELTSAICDMFINHDNFDQNKIRNYAVNEYDFERISDKIIKFYMNILESH